MISKMDRATNEVRRAYAGNAEWPDVHLALVLSLVHGKNHLHSSNNNALLFLKNPVIKKTHCYQYHEE